MLKSPSVIAGIVVVVVGLLAWLLVRGSKRVREWLHEAVEPGKPRWTYALTPLAAALAPLAAFSALLPTYLSQQQSDRKFMTEADRSRTDSTWQHIRLDSANLKHAVLTGANLQAAMHLSPSVTKVDAGPDKEKFPALKRRYPNDDRAAVEARSAEAAAGKYEGAPVVGPHRFETTRFPRNKSL